MQLSTAVWNILNGKPITNPSLRKAAVDALRSSPNYLKPIVKIALDDYEEELDFELSRYAEEYRRSPNQSKGFTPEHIILHHTSGSWWGDISWILNPTSDVSYHYEVNTDGSRVQFVWDSYKAWHAGRSKWSGLIGMNKYSYGLAWTGDTYKREPTFEEIDSMARKIVYLIDKNGWESRDLEELILTHQDIAPKRKNDCAPLWREKTISRVRKLLSI